MFIGVEMTCTLGGLIQYYVQFMCSIITCLIYDQANIGGGGGGGGPAPMVPTPMMFIPVVTYVHTYVRTYVHLSL